MPRFAFRFAVQLGRRVCAPSTAFATGAQPSTLAPSNPEMLAPLDRPMSVAWPVANSWTDGMEREYADFIEQLGRAVSERRCLHIDDCLPRSRSERPL